MPSIPIPRSPSNLQFSQHDGDERPASPSPAYRKFATEPDYHVGQVLDAVKDMGIDNDTIVIFCSDNGPTGDEFREFGNDGTPDMGNSGPFRGALGEATEGSIRTFAFVRWPGHVKPDTSSYAMFSIMDFMPTLASIVGGKMSLGS